MRHGKIIQSGSPREIYNNPVDAETARFFSDFNEFDGVVEDGAVAVPLGRISADGIPDGTNVEVLVRPSAIELCSNGGFEVQVRTSRFLGDHCLVTLAVANYEKAIRMKLRDSEAPASGDVVRVCADPEHIFVFPK